jgi:hypothetical protein
MLGFCSQTLKQVLSQGLNQQGRPEPIARSISAKSSGQETVVRSRPLNPCRDDCDNINQLAMALVRIIRSAACAP